MAVSPLKSLMPNTYKFAKGVKGLIGKLDGLTAHDLGQSLPSKTFAEKPKRKTILESGLDGDVGKLKTLFNKK